MKVTELARQRENFLALMANYDRALELETVALNSNGVAMEKFQTYLESIEASINELKTAFEDLVFSEETVFLIKATINALTELLKIIKALAPAIITLVGIKTVDKLFDKLTDGAKEWAEGLDVANTLLGQMFGKKQILDGIEATTVGFKGLMGTLTTFTLVLGAVIGISRMIASSQEATRNNLKETAKMYKSDAESLDELIKKQEDIASQIETMEAMDKSIVNPNDLEALKAENEQLKEQIKLKQQAHKESLGDAVDDAFNTLNTGMNQSMPALGVHSLKDTVQAQIAAYNDAERKIKDYTLAYDRLKARESELNAKEIEQLYRYKNTIEIYKEQREKYAVSLKDNTDTIVASLEILKASGDDSGLVETYTPVAEAAKALLDNLAKLNPVLAENIGYIEDLEDATDDLNAKEESEVEILQQLAEAQKLVAQTQEDISDTGAVTASTLSQIIARFPDMEEAVNRYILGLINEKELLDQLQLAYKNDEKAKLQSVLNKYEMDTEYYNKLITLYPDLIDKFKELYDVDLSNAKNLAEAKLEIDKLLIGTLAGAWADYYEALGKNEKEAVKKIIGVAAQSPGLVGEANKRILDALNALDLHNEAIEALNNLSLEPLKLQFDRVTAATNTSKEAASEYNKELKAAQTASNKLLEYTISMLKKEAEIRRDALKEELDNYKKIIDARKEALDLQKEQYNYSKEIASKNSAISELEAKIAALQFDTSAEGVAKRLELEKQLNDAREDLADTQYEHSIDQQKDALDKEYEDFKDQQEAKIKVIERYLKESGKLAQEAMELIDSKADGLFNRLMEEQNTPLVQKCA